MSLKIKRRSAPVIPPLEPGTYPAVCVGIVDLGEQYSETYKNYASKQLIIWEIPSQIVSIDGEDKPRWLSREFSASLNEKSNLYKTLISWRGKAFTEDELAEDSEGNIAFDVLTMLGTGCLLQVIVEEKDTGSYNRITSVVGLPVGMPVPETQTPLMPFDMDAWDDAIFELLPEWVKAKIKKSTEYARDHPPTDVIDVKLPGKEENPI